MNDQVIVSSVDSLPADIENVVETQRDLEFQLDRYYCSTDPTPWEMIDLNDLASFLQNAGIEYDNTSSILSIGCGRGRRDLVMLQRVAGLNRPDVSYLGIDLSGSAIRAACRLVDEMTLFGFDKEVEGHTRRPRLKCACSFLRQNFLDISPRYRYDMVIDWMCMHDIEGKHIYEWTARIKSLCKSLLAIKVFSPEGSSISELGTLGRGIRKNQISEQRILDLFRPDFEIIHSEQYPEDLDPHPRPADGIVAAKRAYLLRRL